MYQKCRLWCFAFGLAALVLVCAGEGASAQSAYSMWECVTTQQGKKDAAGIPVRFLNPAWSVCISNETGQPINYQKRWGPDPFDTHTVYRGEFRAHFCNPSRATCILPFYVQHDIWQADPHRAAGIIGRSLKTYQQHDKCMKCGLAANYAFVRRGNQIILEQRR